MSFAHQFRRPLGATPVYQQTAEERILALPRYAIQYAATADPDVERAVGLAHSATGGYVRLADVLTILREARDG